jgi:Uma2 family endonuclease
MVAMISRWTEAPVSLGDYLPVEDQPVVIEGVDWDGYEALLALRGERSRPKLAYLDGVVELMSTSRKHEGLKSVVGCLVEAYCFERDIDFSAYGNWTLMQRVKRAGIEADECYIFGPRPRDKDRPGLAIEIVWTSGGINKLEAYRRLEVGEVWFWKRDAIAVHVLDRDGYAAHERSVCLPDLDLELVCRLVRVEPMSEAIKRLRAILRDPGRHRR